ncbi:MAG TPA: hypothetical protein VF914_22540 [Chloroflexia bacterium]|jgi:hypothetical protein
MIHATRVFSIKPATLDEMVQHFEYTDSWCACVGFRVEHQGQPFLLLNDSFEYGSEFAVCVVLAQSGSVYTVEQQESITLGWVEPPRIPAVLQEAFEFRGMVSRAFTVIGQDYQNHHCGLCA